MALQGKRGWTADPFNKVDRAITSVSLTNFDLKDSTDVVNPSLILNVPDAAKSDMYTKTNMLYIDAFKRWYNVDNFDFSAANRIIYRCSCDVLKSFAADIKANSYYVSRQENNYNSDIVDNLLPRENKFIPQSFASYDLGWSPSTFCYVLQIVGGVVDGGVRTYIMDGITYRHLIDEFFGITTTTIFNSDPAANVISAVKIPIAIGTVATKTSATATTNIYIGNSVVAVPQLASCYMVNNPIMVLSNTEISFTRRYNDWKDFETNYRIFVPYCGIIDANGAEIYIDDVPYYCAVVVDIVTGNVNTFIYNFKTQLGVPPKELAKWTTTGNCAINAPVSGSNVSGVLSSAFSIAGAVITKNPAMIAGAATQAVMTPSKMSYTAGIVAGSTAWNLPQSLDIIKTDNVYVTASNYGHTNGFPSHRTISGAALSGYTICDNVQMTWSGNPAPTEKEIQQIKTLLENGVIF